MSIDTSTLDGKIAVMKAAREGADIEVKVKEGNSWCRAITPSWDWSRVDYRIAPKPREFVLGLTARGVCQLAVTPEYWEKQLSDDQKENYRARYEIVTVQEKSNA